MKKIYIIAIALALSLVPHFSLASSSSFATTTGSSAIDFGVSGYPSSLYGSAIINASSTLVLASSTGAFTIIAMSIDHNVLAPAYAFCKSGSGPENYLYRQNQPLNTIMSGLGEFSANNVFTWRGDFHCPAGDFKVGIAGGGSMNVQYVLYDTRISTTTPTTGGYTGPTTSEFMLCFMVLMFILLPRFWPFVFSPIISVFRKENDN